MSVLDTFFILFDSDASKLDKGLEETEKKADGLIDKLKGVDKEGTTAGAKLFELTSKAAGLLGVGMSIGALVAGVKATAASYDELGKLATRFRSTTDAVDEFRDAAGLLNITEETSVGALKALDAAVQDTALGLGRAKKVFEEIGVSATDATGKARPTLDVMADLAGVMKDMERGKQIRIMERLGLDPSLLKLFNADFVALQKRMAEIDKASGFNLDQAVKRAAEYTKANKAMSLEVNTLKMYLDKLSEGFKLSTMPFFTEALTVATRYVKTFVDFLLRHKPLVEGVFLAVAGGITYFLIPAAIKGAIAVWAMIAPFALVGLAVAAVVAVFALLYDDIVTFMDGGESLIGQLLEWVQSFELLNAIVVIVAAAFRFLWAAFGAGLGVISNFLTQSPPLQTAFGAIKDAIDAVGRALEWVWGLLKDFGSNVGAVMDSIGGAFGRGLDVTTKAIIEGKDYLNSAASSPLGSLTSNSISTTNRGGRTTQVTVGKVEVKTAATDAEGISKAIGGSMAAQMRQAASNYDDGVLA